VLKIGNMKTPEEILRKACGYNDDQELELNDEISVSESLEAMQIYEGQLREKIEKRIVEIKKESQRHIKGGFLPACFGDSPVVVELENLLK